MVPRHNRPTPTERQIIIAWYGIAVACGCVALVLVVLFAIAGWM